MVDYAVEIEKHREHYEVVELFSVLAIKYASTLRVYLY